MSQFVRMRFSAMEVIPSLGTQGRHIDVGLFHHVAADGAAGIFAKKGKFGKPGLIVRPLRLHSDFSRLFRSVGQAGSAACDLRQFELIMSLPR
jgi:hypothetical protein